jgi:hypothetical protein
MQTLASTKQAALRAWSNAAGTHPLSPLLTALAAHLQEAPDTETDFSAQRHMSAFARRIATPGERPQLRHRALDYQQWTGEWHVTNEDLTFWARFRMWLHRFAEDEQMADFLSSGITRALAAKRMQQAFLRYQSTGLTAAHCALIEHAGWEVETGRGDWVSLFVQGKRPFGNSSIEYDIYDHARWPMDWPKDDGMSPQQEERAWDLFDELPFALPDIARTAAATLTTP